MIIAVDIGGTKMRIGYSEIGDHLKDYIDIPTPINQRVVVSTISETIKKLVGSSTEIDAIGIAAPGPINKDRGTIISPRTIPWRNLRIVQGLKKIYNCPVVLEHDATAGGIAEARIGAGKDHSVVLYITLSTGIGNSIIVDGSPLPSKHNPEGGWQLIGTDPSEDRFSLQANGKAIEQRFGKKPSEIHDHHTWQIIAQDLALGIYNMITIIQPDCVILGGGVSVNYKRFIKPLKRRLAELSPVYPLPKITKARYTDTAPAIGAILLAIEKIR